MSASPIADLNMLASNAVRARGALTLEVLARLAEACGHRWVLADLAYGADREALFRVVGRAFGLPEWFGANLDALYDSLRDLIDATDAPGFVIVLLGLGGARALDPQQRVALLDVFRDAAELAADRGVAWRVFYD
jgi:RNAse (barnase) inhibitor barstar